MTIMNCIVEYVDRVKYRVPIFTKVVYEYVKTIIPNVDKGVFNEYLARYARRNSEFVRYQKGIYYKTLTTPFGRAGINYTELVKMIYLTDGKEVFGYETGPSLMNKIGLTTQMPAYTYLVSERARNTINDEEQLIIFKPVIKVNAENYRYLQFIDILDNRMKVNVEAKNAQKILRNFIDKYNLNFETLLRYARYYKNKGIFAMIAELAR